MPFSHPHPFALVSCLICPLPSICPDPTNSSRPNSSDSFSLKSFQIPNQKWYLPIRNGISPSFEFLYLSGLWPSTAIYIYIYICPHQCKFEDKNHLSLFQSCVPRALLSLATVDRGLTGQKSIHQFPGGHSTPVNHLGRLIRSCLWQENGKLDQLQRLLPSRASVS